MMRTRHAYAMFPPKTPWASNCFQLQGTSINWWGFCVVRNPLVFLPWNCLFEPIRTVVILSSLKQGVQRFTAFSFHDCCLITAEQHPAFPAAVSQKKQKNHNWSIICNFWSTATPLDIAHWIFMWFLEALANALLHQLFKKADDVMNSWLLLFWLCFIFQCSERHSFTRHWLSAVGNAWGAYLIWKRKINSTLRPSMLPLWSVIFICFAASLNLMQLADMHAKSEFVLPATASVQCLCLKIFSSHNLFLLWFGFFPTADSL